MNSKSRIISLEVNNLSFDDSMQKVVTQGMNHRPGFVCFANVHMTIEAYKDEAFRAKLKKALFVLPDGKPIALACKWLWGVKQERVAGMDFMPAIFRQAHDLKGKIFLYGSTREVLDRIIEKAKTEYPNATIIGSISPPFRKLSETEIREHIKMINDSGANFVLVALGCPKQENWMATYYPAINAVLLGLGGAFPVMAGTQKRSPEWMQFLALEWLYRLFQEPKRLFKRYLYTNTLFISLLVMEKLRPQKSKPYV